VLLDDVQKTLFDRAVAFRDEHTVRVNSWDEFTAAMEGRPGFVIAPWCGSDECEAKIKSDTQATIRNMPMFASKPTGKCIHCDGAAIAEAWFAKAY
jgi:prolyl-tRNA synthetase